MLSEGTALAQIVTNMPASVPNAGVGGTVSQTATLLSCEVRRFLRSICGLSDTGLLVALRTK